MRQLGFSIGRASRALGLLFLVAATACSHRQTPGGANGGSSGTGAGNGGSSGTGTVDPTAGTNPGGGTSPGGGATGQGGEVVITGGRSGDPVMKMACMDRAYSDKFTPGYVQSEAVLTEVRTALSGLSTQEKADQMRGTDQGGGNNYTDIFRTPDNTSKGLKGFQFRDGPRGVNLASQLPSGRQGYSTSFPAPMARGAAFDLDLEYRIGVAIGDETLASGNTMMLAPTINILRHPAWGRAQETYGEDPYLLGRIGSAFVVGVQEFVPACAKHYAANNIENGRSTANAQMDEQTLREMYARHFEMVIKEGGVACVMAAYNPVNGTNSTQNRHLLTDLLRTDFGFKGFVLSDWWAMPGSRTLQAPDVAVTAIQAGMEMELPWSLNYSRIESITGAGLPLSTMVLDTAVSRILEQKFRFKVGRTSGQLGLKPPTTRMNGQNSIEGNDAHITLAEEAALKGITLLKNDMNTLPIQRSAVRTIAVIGADVSYEVKDTDNATGTISFATAVRTGDLGSSRVFHDPAKAVGPFAGIQAAAGAGITVVSGNSAAAAANADFIVAVAGLTPQDEGEEYTGAGDRPSFALDAKKPTPAQNNLITSLIALNKPMVVVLEGGSVIDMPWLAQVRAVVMAWYPGMVGGRALGKLLFGDANFSGKLPITWPARFADEPTFSGGASTMMDYFLGYRRFDQMGIAPLFPFGHGLSYTNYTYANLQVPCSTVTKNGVIDVKVDVTNAGTVKGDEIVYLFVSYPSTTARRPIKELKGFYRVALDPGQTKQITIPLRVYDLKYWNMASSKWMWESGPVKIWVAKHAGFDARATVPETVALSDTVTVMGD